MITIYTRKEVAELLGISEQWVVKSKKVIKVNYYSQRSKKYVIRYLLVKEILNEELIKKTIKEQTW